MPHDVSVIGYDNIAFAAYLNPPLSSISQPKQELACWSQSLLSGSSSCAQGVLCVWSPIWCCATPRHRPAIEHKSALFGALWWLPGWLTA